MDKIDRMREDMINHKFDEDTKGALNLILDLMEEHREGNRFIKRLINGYFCIGNDI